MQTLFATWFFRLPPLQSHAGQTIGPLEVIYADILGWEVELFWMDSHKENNRNMYEQKMYVWIAEMRVDNIDRLTDAFDRKVFF